MTQEDAPTFSPVRNSVFESSDLEMTQKNQTLTAIRASRNSNLRQPVGKIGVPNKALIIVDFPELVRPKKATKGPYKL